MFNKYDELVLIKKQEAAANEENIYGLLLPQHNYWAKHNQATRGYPPAKLLENWPHHQPRKQLEIITKRRFSDQKDRY